MAAFSIIFSIGIILYAVQRSKLQGDVAMDMFTELNGYRYAIFSPGWDITSDSSSDVEQFLRILPQVALINFRAIYECDSLVAGIFIKDLIKWISNRTINLLITKLYVTL